MTKRAAIPLLFLLMLSGAAYGQDEPLRANVARVTSDNGGVGVPDPDPTKLTTEAVDRLKENLLELFGARLEAVNKELERLAKRIEDRPEEVEKQIGRLEALTDEKFKGVDQQFAGRDVALAAALLAQKTSVEEQNKSNALSASKSEAGFAKQIDGISALITAQSKGTDDKINDLKDRLTAIESRGEGVSDAWGWLVGALGIGLAVVMAGLAFSRREIPARR